MIFTLEIKCDNAAFGYEPATRDEEVARILRSVAHQLEQEWDRIHVQDANGNTVGSCEFEED